MHAITENRSFSMIDTISAESDTIAKMPANVVNRTQPANPMTFIKVLETIESILVIV